MLGKEERCAKAPRQEHIWLFEDQREGWYNWSTVIRGNKKSQRSEKKPGAGQCDICQAKSEIWVFFQ